MTNGWTDIRNADVVLAMGGNPAENHPVGFRFAMDAKRNRNAKLVCVDPRFNRTAAVADQFVQIRVGTDIAFLGGLIHYALSRNRFHEDYGRGFAKTDASMQHPRSVFQVMKTFYSRYTPAAVANICGCTAEEFEKTAELLTSTYTPDRAGTIMYALGWTHHSHSVQLIHAAAMLQLLLGNIGRPGGGINA